MEQDLLISVIIPVYKVEEYLAKCVDSVLAQTYGNLEVILVDDGSPDGCGKICDDYAARDSRVKVIHKQNGGLSSARNAGIDAASGDYLAFVDSDDWIEPDAYDAMLSAALQYHVKLVCAGRLDEDAGTGAVREGLCPQKEEVVSGKELVSRIFRWDHLDSAAWDKLYARELFREIRYPFGRVVEDVPTTYRIALLAGSAVLLPKRIYHYLHRENSITTAAVSEKTFHFSQNAARVYADIRENWPELETEARYLRVRSLYYNLWMEDRASEEAKKRYAGSFDDSRRELKAELGFVLGCKLFPPTEKLELSLMALGLYHTFRKLYHRIKDKA